MGRAALKDKIFVRGAAELIVIVIGVLIALWIEGWREDRIAVADEQEYLERLVADLVADSTRIANRHAAELRTRTRADAALRFSEQGWAVTTDTSAVLTDYHFAGFVNFFVFETATWADLVATGNLGLLRDAELRQRLGAYHRHPALLLLFEMDDSRKELLWYQYRPVLSAYFPGGFLNQLVTTEGLSSYPSIDFEGLRRDPEVISGLKSASGLAEVYARNLERLAEENSETLEMVRGARDR
jgi:hypothetical protein